MKELPSVDIELAEVADAVESADILVAVTTAREPLFVAARIAELARRS
jgi:ornithine cyclodeaminase/alanine dehydrogenase-like protein (mu-crystallin family)